MKIVQACRKLFRSITYFFDKYFVTPVTKLIFIFTNKYGKSGRQIENWLSSTNTLLFISLLLAFAIFIMIDKKIIVFKQRPKKGYRKKQGHRQQYSRVMINKINTKAGKKAQETEAGEE